MYENDAMVRNSRPSGANSIETRLQICVFTRDYQFERMTQADLPYVEYIIARFVKIFTAKDGKVNIVNQKDFEAMIALEVQYCQTVLLVTPTGELTSRGITFLEMTLNGSYQNIPTKFDNVMAIYAWVLTMEVAAFQPASGDEMCTCDECMVDPVEYRENKEENPEMVTASIPVKEFVYLVDKYKEEDKSIVARFKRLFNGGK